MDLNGIVSSIPGMIGSLLLLIAALILAHFARKYAIKAMESIDFDLKLQKWGLARTDEESNTFLETIGTLLYFIIVLFFVPFILNGLGLAGVVDPISNMFAKFFAYIPNIIAAALIIFIGNLFCKFVKQLTQNLLEGFNLDRWYSKMTGQAEQEKLNDTHLAEVLSTVVYVLIFIPILTVALETLGIQTISAPIVGVLNSVMSAIPNIIVAVILVFVGGFIAKLLGDLLESLLKTSGIDQYSKYLNFKGENHIQISSVIAQVAKSLLLIFFIVEAISVLNLEVLNAIGTSIIAYIPDVIAAALILAVGVIGGNILASFLKEVSGSKVFGEFVRYAIIVLAIFMTLNQLKFAPTIVNAAFIIILSAVAIAFALAVGIGGKEFAARQLENIEKSIEHEEEENQRF
ncbi:Conserved TM helix [Facklamia miroungae]|uniref:Conserved TM helix n=2 Tax=Facklamia miroungae TaxID=120956 RepID=A0A1G7RPZ6_9LACT|nr:mechanosensitive ion channel [Facklamia miroungae]NKZ29343.1 mechanosensitive ion channel [Facklamia miroungae]SDG12279.1 Conserved TM helix [Facklamia miroungae]